MKNKIQKFESPSRLSELSPKETLIKAGFTEGMVLCDIGAGSGIFTFPAADISSSRIYAVEISDNMIQVINDRILERQISNIIVKRSDGDKLPIDDGACDMAVMVTVFHEIGDKGSMLREVQRILKDKGRFVVIEFHKDSTSMGPPPEHRISEEEVAALCESRFSLLDKFDLGENFYCLVFEKKSRFLKLTENNCKVAEQMIQ